jgi:hypothetical protein
MISQNPTFHISDLIRQERLMAELILTFIIVLINLGIELTILVILAPILKMCPTVHAAALSENSHRRPTYVQRENFLDGNMGK